MTGCGPARQRFSDAERRRLLAAPGIGPAVVDRLELVGIHTLAQLQALGGEQAARRVGQHLQQPGWANRGRVLQRALVAASGPSTPKVTRQDVGASGPTDKPWCWRSACSAPRAPTPACPATACAAAAAAADACEA